MEKYVLTGGPCCGKSTTIDEIARRGYSVIEEVARGVLKERKNFPLDKEENRTRQKIIFEKSLYNEYVAQLRGDDVFLDRGIPDVFVYNRHLVGEEFECKLPSGYRHYSKIFLLDQLPFVKDDVRVEKGEDEAQELSQMISDEYVSRGYEVLRVPVFGEDLNARVDFILSNLE